MEDYLKNITDIEFLLFHRPPIPFDITNIDSNKNKIYVNICYDKTVNVNSHNFIKEVFTVVVFKNNYKKELLSDYFNIKVRYIDNVNNREVYGTEDDFKRFEKAFKLALMEALLS